MQCSSADSSYRFTRIHVINVPLYKYNSIRGSFYSYRYSRRTSIEILSFEENKEILNPS